MTQSHKVKKLDKFVSLTSRKLNSFSLPLFMAKDECKYSHLSHKQEHCGNAWFLLLQRVLTPLYLSVSRDHANLNHLVQFGGRIFLLHQKDGKFTVVTVGITSLFSGGSLYHFGTFQ